jgi:arsenate reductase (thioredoxin)
MSEQLSFGQESKPGSSATNTILFVCEHGAARSTIAAAYFNKLAKENGLNYEAIFRGTDPDSTLLTGAKQGLTRDGFDIEGWRPLPVTPENARKATVIITFDCKLPVDSLPESSIQQWNGIPPISKDYEIAKNQILERVILLIRSLTKKPEK